VDLHYFVLITGLERVGDRLINAGFGIIVPTCSQKTDSQKQNREGYDVLKHRTPCHRMLHVFFAPDYNRQEMNINENRHYWSRLVWTGHIEKHLVKGHRRKI